MSKLKFELIIDTVSGEVSIVNTSTGEVKSAAKKSSKKKVESTEPTLILEDNKCCLNQAAIDLMGAEPNCKIDIKYKKEDNGIVPVIATEESFGTHGGNRLTKSLTIACRGSKHDELAKYGTEFLLVPHKIKDGIFILQDKNVKESDNTEEISIPTDIDIQDIIDNNDAEITEIDSSIFKL